jgi:uncharacterized caspase-like protein
MPHRPPGLVTLLALTFLWSPLAIASPPSGVSAPLLVATTAGVPDLRTALVIGNAAYQDTPRRTAVHDAVDMAAALRQLGFQVMEHHDATRQHMDEAIAQFTHQLSKGGIGLFYFSGHGMQVNGLSYLIPVDARLSRESDLQDQAIRLDGALDRLGEAGNGLNLIILDASRHNPFARSGRSARPGLAVMQEASGSLIAYATAPGMVAEDGPGRNSTYTTYLLRFLKMPGLSVDQLFHEVRIAVARETGRRQIPWVSSSIPGEFSFTGR